MSAATMLELPLASEVPLLSLPRLPEPDERPGWVEYEDRNDDRGVDGSAAVFWRRVVETSYGDLLVEQFLWATSGAAAVNVSRGYWDSAGYQFELTAPECRGLADALWKIGRVVEQIDRDTLRLSAVLGAPWITTTEAAKRRGTTGREIREAIDAGDLVAVTVGSLTYVPEAVQP